MATQSVIVVTISEMLPAHCNDVDTVVFSDWDKAEAWIESQVKTFGLDRESAVDGWFVEIDGYRHSGPNAPWSTIRTPLVFTPKTPGL